LVPILVEGAEMPRATDLPDTLQPLARINAIELSDQRWTSDIERLAKVIRDLEAYQEAKATHVRSSRRAPDVRPTQAAAATQTVRLADIDGAVLRTVVAAMPPVFRTKDVSGHEHMRHAHGALAAARNYHVTVGQYLQANQQALGLAPPCQATDERGAVWRRATGAPQVGDASAGLEISPAYAAPVSPLAQSPPSSSAQQVVGWLMVAVPICTCTFLAFVPSMWVAYMRRHDRRLMRRALMASAGFLALDVVGFVLIAVAPEDSSGSPSGAMNGIGATIAIVGSLVAAALAAFQHDPTEALSRPR
jgi:hypothetical protein